MSSRKHHDRWTSPSWMCQVMVKGWHRWRIHQYIQLLSRSLIIWCYISRYNDCGRLWVRRGQRRKRRHYFKLCSVECASSCYRYQGWGWGKRVVSLLGLNRGNNGASFALWRWQKKSRIRPLQAGSFQNHHFDFPLPQQRQNKTCERFPTPQHLSCFIRQKASVTNWGQ